MRSYFGGLNKKFKSSNLVVSLIKSKNNFNSFFWVVLGGKSNFTLDFVSLGFYKHKGNKKICFMWVEELMCWLYFGASITYKMKKLLFFINLFKLNNKFFLFFSKKSLFYLQDSWIFFNLFISKYLDYEKTKLLGGQYNFKAFLNNFL